MEGILPLWKEKGMTSHDCVFKLRKILGMKKIGHGGTLDPDVAGVLPICLGKGTKVVEYMMDSGKVYEGEITLGFSTTTEDASGETVAETFLTKPFSEIEIDAAMAKFVGEILQIPPMYSAVKVNGKRLYEYARAGEEVERPQRIANIYCYERLDTPVFHEETGTQSWRFRVACGKGTYVRTLAVDTGASLGVAAHMSDLVRKESGGLHEAQCLTLEQVREEMKAGTLEGKIFPLEVALQDFQRLVLDDETYGKVKNGVCLSYQDYPTLSPDRLTALFYQDLAVGIYQSHPTKVGIMKPAKILRN